MTEVNEAILQWATEHSTVDSSTYCPSLLQTARHLSPAFQLCLKGTGSAPLVVEVLSEGCEASRSLVKSMTSCWRYKTYRSAIMCEFSTEKQTKHGHSNEIVLVRLSSQEDNMLRCCCCVSRTVIDRVCTHLQVFLKLLEVFVFCVGR